MSTKICVDSVMPPELHFDLEQIDFSIVVNDDVRAELMRRGESSARIRVIASGINIDRFQPSRFEHPETRGEPLTFGYLGRLSEEKRPLDVVEMARRFPQFRFIMAGEGPMRPQVEAQCFSVGGKFSPRPLRATSRVVS